MKKSYYTVYVDADDEDEAVEKAYDEYGMGWCKENDSCCECWDVVDLGDEDNAAKKTQSTTLKEVNEEDFESILFG